MRPAVAKIEARNKVRAMEKNENPENSGRKKGGRPAKEVKKEKTISVHCSYGDYLTIKARAEEVGLKISQFLLRVGMDKPLPTIRTPEQIQELRELRGMATNLNQIAKSVNAGETLNEVALDDYQKISQYIKKLYK